MNDDDHERREFVRRLFDNAENVPRDVVPGSGLTREDLLRQNDAVGTWKAVEQPGEVILDVDGVPMGVEASTRQAVYFGGTIVTRSELERLGLNPEDVPNLKVMPDPRRRTNNE